jgi:hypothetical protein
VVPLAYPTPPAVDALARWLRHLVHDAIVRWRTDLPRWGRRGAEVVADLTVAVGGTSIGLLRRGAGLTLAAARTLLTALARASARLAVAAARGLVRFLGRHPRLLPVAGGGITAFLLGRWFGDAHGFASIAVIIGGLFVPVGMGTAAMVTGLVLDPNLPREGGRWFRRRSLDDLGLELFSDLELVELSEPALVVDHESVEPEPVEPEPVEAESVEPESVEPEPVEPKSVEPESVEPEAGGARVEASAA